MLRRAAAHIYPGESAGKIVSCSSVRWPRPVPRSGAGRGGISGPGSIHPGGYYKWLKEPLCNDWDDAQTINICVNSTRMTRQQATVPDR